MNKETIIIQDRFLSWDEAVIFIDHAMDTHSPDEFTILECRVVKLEGIWSAGITFIKAQGDLFDR